MRSLTLAELLEALRAHDVRMWEEGGELRVRAPGGVLSEELRQELRRQKGDVLALLARARGRSVAPIPRVDRGGDIPLSSAQRRLWVLEQIRSGERSAYNISTAFLAAGPLDLTLLQTAFADVIDRHEVLRTGVRDERGEPKGTLAQVGCAALDISDWSARPDAEAAFRAEARALAEAPFDLSAPPLVRFAVRQLGADRFGCIVVLHHLVADGESLPILMRDLATCYNDRRSGRPVSLPPLRIQYADFSAWQDAQDDDAASRYWRRQFEDAPAPLDLPTDGPRAAEQSFAGDTVRFQIGRATVAGLQGAARSVGASLFMTLLAATAAVLQRWTNQDDLVIGTPARGRSHPDLEEQVGCYVNTLALRCRLDRRDRFIDLLGRVRETVTQAFEHESFPFDRLVDQLSVPRDTGRSPLFDVMLSLAPEAPAAFDLEGVAIEPIDVRPEVSQLDLTVNFAPSSKDTGGLDASVQYRTDLFGRPRIERLAAHLTAFLDGLARDPSSPLRDITTLSSAERRQLLTTFNETEAPYDTSETIVGRFLAQAARAPEATAVIDAERRWSFAEIDRRSDAVALQLLRRGVNADARVALLARRGERMMVGLLGILKAGGAYVPIQPDDPPQRIEALLADCRPAAVLRETDVAEWSTGDAERPRIQIRPESLAYVLYTSGSTGKPKGVQIQHGSVVNRITWMDREYGLGPGDVVLQKTPYTFDVSVWELFWWAFSGATVAFLPPDAERDPAAIVDAVHRQRVTKMHFVPSMLRAFLDHVGQGGDVRLASLRDVFASGEALPADLVLRFQEVLTARHATRLHNLYGPTEATVDVSYFDCTRLAGTARVPIGAPIANTQLYVLDRDLNPSPLGVSGEIFIGGVNVGRGYLDRPDLTAERFVPDPWRRDGARLYRTGDVGRWRDDGQLEFLGRNDAQVKVRGHRIELGEVEAVLCAHPQVGHAAALVRDGQLVAYLTGASDLTVGSVREFLAARLPAYMVPTRFAMVAHWPLTSSGKLDRRALPAPEDAPLGTGRGHLAPRTDTERLLADVFARVLGLPAVSADDDFFERGGHSLLATRVVAHARQEHGLDVGLRDLFANPTVAGLAACADGREPFRGRPLRAIEPQPNYPVSHAQRRLWLTEQRAPGGAAYNVAAAFIVSGALDVGALVEAWRRLQARHESLRTRFCVVNGEPRQEIIEAPEIRIDLAETPGAPFVTEASRIAAAPFDLGQAPLVRMAVRRLAEAEYGWIVVLHHIVCDGWSMPILVRELVACYEDARAGRSTLLPPLRIQYKDYASWQRALVDDEGMEAHRRFWLGLFATPPPRLQLPFERGTGRPEGGGADRAVLRISAGQTAGLRDLGRRHGASLFMTLLATVQSLLFRYTGQTDLTLGTVTAGRIHPDVERQIGFYVNTLALRSTLDAAESFAGFLERVRDSTLEAFDHQAYPFDSLVDALDLEPDGRFPLFDVMVVLQNNETADLRLSGLTLRPVELPPSGSKFDLSFHFAETAGALELTLEFREDRFAREAVERMAAEFAVIVDAVLMAPERVLGELPLPSDAVREQTLAVVSTFTAEPLEEPLAFWMARLGTPSRVVFAPFGQVFQQLLDPSSLIGRNRHGANVCLLRLSDWMRAANPLMPVPGHEHLFADHETHVLPNGTAVAHLNAYETEDVYREIFVDRVYARHGITLHDGDVVFDIGANIGLFSLFARSSADDLQLYGFEPAPATFEALRRNMAVYCPGARLFNCGIGAVEGHAPFTFYPKSSVFSSYHPDTVADAAAIRAVVRNLVEREGAATESAVATAADVFMEDRMHAETTLVPIRTLSGVIREHGIERIDLLKLDAEKSERQILQGLDDDDWSKIRQIVIEVHEADGRTLDDVTHLLTTRGFDVAVDEEARLHETGLFTLYGRRPTEPTEVVTASDRNVTMFADAVRAAAQRTPAVPFIVVSCPELDPRSGDAEAELARRLARVPGVEFVSSLDLARTYPVDAPYDSRADELGRVPYTPEQYAALATMVARRLQSARRPPFKVVVLDADQTLWRGVVGEDGADGISLDPPRRALQEFMVAQRRVGMLLCLCSKNAEEDVVRAFERHEEMPLRLDDFVARRINWRPKSENIRSLAAELGLGLDSFLFVDDSPLECADVRAACPEVLTLCLPEHAERIPDVLRGTWAFDRAAVTAEDASRSDAYAAAGDRERVRAEAPTLEAFIAGLDLRIEITPMAVGDIPRVAQLTQRTNQFNTTTIRRTDAEVEVLPSTERCLSVVRVRDRFGDYGLVGVSIYSVGADALVVEAMMLSCRALGRGVEHRMVAHLGREAASRGLARVDLRLLPTSRNRPARDFLDSLECGKERDGEGWTYRVPAAAAISATLAHGATPPEVMSTSEGARPAPKAAASADASAGLMSAADIAQAAAEWSRGRGLGSRRKRRSDIVQPRTAIERSLASIWGEILGIADVGANESFFDLGGHSLKAIRMLSRAAQALGVELTLGDLFADPTIGGLARRAAARDPVAREQIPVAAAAPNYPLSGAQRRLWILSELGGQGAVAYNVPSAFVLTGDLDVSALEDAFHRLVARHESLRTRFVVVDGEPRQAIDATVEFHLRCDDSRVLDEAAFVGEATRLANEPIDFAHPPLLRAAVMRLTERRWGLVIVIHHVITDGWSIPILVRELLAFYDDARRGITSNRPPLRIHYKDYAVWQSQLLSSARMADQQHFWHQQFQEAPVPLDLPADNPRPPVQNFHGDHVARRLDAGLASALGSVAAAHGTTLFMILLAALDVLLYRYTGETDLTVGSPMTGRIHPDLEDQVGFYVNTLALRTRLLPRESFASLLDRVRDETAAAFHHQAYPFDRLVEELRLPRDLGRSPLFDVMLVVEPEEQAPLALTEIDVRPVGLRHDVSRFDMTVHVVQTREGLELGVQYSTALFRPERVTAMCGHFETLLRSVVNDPSRAVADLAIVDGPERRQLVGELASGLDPRDLAQRAAAPPPSSGDTLVDLFREQARRTPDGVALIPDETATVTYRELDERSDRLARDLVSRGVKPEQPVGVLGSRSASTFVAMLGVMKAGGTYLPLDPSLPQARVDYMVADSGTTIVLTDDAATAGAPALPRPVSAQLAYVIYTSGSTGQPKGVGVTHASLANMAADQIRAFDLGPRDVIGQFASVGFDASLYEAFLALLSGATLAIVPDEARVDPAMFLSWTHRVRPTVLVLPPAFLRTLERAPMPSVRLLVTAGEQANPDDARHYAETMRYVNAYGPTEFAICATWGDVTPVHDGAIPIGRPVAHTAAYVLDERGEPAPVGVPGELYLGGKGVARGYIHRPALTAARFVPDPFGAEPGGRLYRTGDLARWRGDGSLEFLGRNDFQVKVRGHRIELGEVESALRAHASVRDAVVVGRELDLIAYVTGESPSADVLKAHLRRNLPEYMVPAHVVPLDALPMTPSGKVDRRALPAPESTRTAISPASELPASDLERAIAKIWCTVLGLPQVGVRDSFFDLGGNSILLARVLSALRRDLAPNLTLLDLFTFPRIQDLATHLTSRTGSQETDAASRIAERADKQRAALSRTRRPAR